MGLMGLMGFSPHLHHPVLIIVLLWNIPGTCLCDVPVMRPRFFGLWRTPLMSKMNFIASPSMRSGDACPPMRLFICGLSISRVGSSSRNAMTLRSTISRSRMVAFLYPLPLMRLSSIDGSMLMSRPMSASARYWNACALRL